MRKLVDHVDAFYGEIYDETAERKNTIIQKIKGKHILNYNRHVLLMYFGIIINIFYYRTKKRAN